MGEAAVVVVRQDPAPSSSSSAAASTVNRSIHMVEKDKEKEKEGTDEREDTDSDDLVFINVSPIGESHLLLVPAMSSGTSQRIEQYGVLLTLDFLRAVGNPALRLAYNSLGAFASVNHQHFQGIYHDKEDIYIYIYI